MTRLRIVEGDLLRQTDLDAIVNAANTHLRHGGGIAGAISRAAGPRMQQESYRLAPVPTGGAVVSTAGNLPFKKVIHAVGPIYRGGEYHEAKLLRLAHMNTVRAAADQDFKKIGLPAISCGIFGYPVELAAPIAIQSLRDACAIYGDLDEVRVCLLDKRHIAAFIKALNP